VQLSSELWSSDQVHPQCPRHLLAKRPALVGCPPAGTSIRILFIFDPRRQAILLLGGDKAGNWKRWYDKNIPLAERRYENWLATEGGG
jgi:hypothetical protein